MRETRVAYAGNRGEASPQIGIKHCRLRIAVSGLDGIQLEQQDILLIKAEVDGLQV